MSAEDFLNWTEGRKIRFEKDESGSVTRVVKLLPPSLFPIYSQLRKLNSPHLPKVLALSQTENALFVTEEYIEGNSLQFILDEQGPLGRAEALRCGMDVARALCLLHTQDPPLLHRDIKPLNILRRKSGEYVLVDFDAARRFSPGASQDTQCILTPGYAPPEQYGFGQSDVRSDIFSLGATLYEAVSGEGYRPGRSLPGSLGRLIAKCTAFSPARRYKSAKHLLRELSKLKQGWPSPVWFILCAIIFIAALLIGLYRRGLL